MSSALTFGVLNVPGGVRNVNAGLRSNTAVAKQPVTTSQVPGQPEQRSVELQEEELSPEAAADFRKGLLGDERSEAKTVQTEAKPTILERTSVKQQFRTTTEGPMSRREIGEQLSGLDDELEIDQLIDGLLDEQEEKQSQAKYFGEKAGLVKDENWKKAHLSSRDNRRLDALSKVLGAQSHFAESGQLKEMEQRFSDVLEKNEKFANEVERAEDDRGTIKYSMKGNYESPIYETLETRKPIKATDFKADKLRRAEAAKKYGLDLVEASRLKAYVDGYMCYRLNTGMLNNQLTDGEKDIAASIESALRKFPKYSGRVYRNLQFKTEERYNAFLAEYAEDEIVLIKAFTSTSKLPNGYPLFGNGVVHLAVDCETGCDIADTYGLVRQQEVILLPDTKLKVTKVATANDGKPLIFAQEVAANADNRKDNGRDSGDKRPSRGVYRVGYEQGSTVGRRGEDPGSVYGEVRRGSGRHGVLPERGEGAEAGDVPVSYDRRKFSESDFFYNPNTQLEVPAEVDAEAFLYGLDSVYERITPEHRRNRSDTAQSKTLPPEEVEKYGVIRYHEDGTVVVTDDRKVRKLDDTLGFDGYTAEQYAHMLSRRAKVSLGQTVTTLPLEGVANSVTDFLLSSGSVKQRRIYGPEGKAVIDYDTDNHGKPKYHPTGAHKHFFNYQEKNLRGEALPLTAADLILNSDIIKEGDNYHAPKTDRSN